MSPHFSLSYLGAELFGGASDKSSFVMVSDGGHFENLAAYELIRRRCRVIVISDGECDDLVHIRWPWYADSGVRSGFQRARSPSTWTISGRGTGGPEWSKRRFAVGDITYEDGSTGTLIYLKASMTGRGRHVCPPYKSSSPAFPHESTSDQFYGEDQFESYRHLGRDIGYEVFGAYSSEPTLVSVADPRRAVCPAATMSIAE